MNSINQLIKFLQTLWGKLALITIAFPGAIVLLKLQIAVPNSNIAHFYPVIATIVSAFATLFLIAYQNDLKDLPFARRLSLWGMVLSLIFFFSFISVRVFVLDLRSDQVLFDEKSSYETIITKNRGLINTVIKDAKGNMISASERSDPYDVLCLIFFTLTFASLTFSFTSLGIHSYQANSEVVTDES